MRKNKGNHLETVKEEATVKANPQPEMTSLQKQVRYWPKILKDATKPAYVDGKVNLENYTTPYAKVGVGGCIWYARGRFEEVTDLEYPFILYTT